MSDDIWDKQPEVIYRTTYPYEWVRIAILFTWMTTLLYAFFAGLYRLEHPPVEAERHREVLDRIYWLEQAILKGKVA